MQVKKNRCLLTAQSSGGEAYKNSNSLVQSQFITFVCLTLRFLCGTIIILFDFFLPARRIRRKEGTALGVSNQQLSYSNVVVMVPGALKGTFLRFPTNIFHVGDFRSSFSTFNATSMLESRSLLVKLQASAKKEENIANKLTLLARIWLRIFSISAIYFF